MIISFGIINSKLLIPFICPILLRFRRYFREKLDKQNAYFKIFFSFLSFISSGILYLVVLLRLYKEKKSSTRIENSIKNLNNSLLLIRSTKGNNNEVVDMNLNEDSNFLLEEKKKYKKKEERKKLYFTLILTLLQMTGLSFHNIWKDRNKRLDMDYRTTVGVFFEFIFLIIFSVKFLKFQIYIHQKFSFLIIIICLIIFFIVTIICKDDKMDIILNIIFFAVHQLFYCLLDVLGKKYLNIYFDNIYFFMFKIGICGLIPVLFYDIMVKIFFDDPRNKYQGVISYFQDSLNETSKIIYFLIDLIFGTIWLISLWLTIYYFSPLHFIILEVLTEFLEIIFNIKDDDENKYKNGQIVAFYVLYPIIIFSILIFNEILILNFWGLNYNTKKYIMKRQEIDTKHCDEIIPSEDSDSHLDSENEEKNSNL